jgi:hypothetical protein
MAPLQWLHSKIRGPVAIMAHPIIDSIAEQPEIFIWINLEYVQQGPSCEYWWSESSTICFVFVLFYLGYGRYTPFFVFFLWTSDCIDIHKHYTLLFCRVDLFVLFPDRCLLSLGLQLHSYSIWTYYHLVPCVKFMGCFLCNTRLVLVSLHFAHGRLQHCDNTLVLL